MNQTPHTSVNTLFFEGVEVYVRKSDNYINVTKVCETTKKRPNDWLRLKPTKELIACFYYDVPEDERGMLPEPVQIVQGAFAEGGEKREQGTWLHPDLAIALAAWLNPKFHVWMLRVTRKLLTEGSVKLSEEMERLEKALGIKEKQLGQYKDHCSRLLQENDAMKCQRFDLHQENSEYEARIKELEEEARDSEERIAELEAKNESAEKQIKFLQKCLADKLRGRATPPSTAITNLT